MKNDDHDIQNSLAFSIEGRIFIINLNLMSFQVHSNFSFSYCAYTSLSFNATDAHQSKLITEYSVYLAGHSIMTVIVTSKVIATRVKNIVARRLDRSNDSASKHDRTKSNPDIDSRKMNGRKVRKKRKRYHGSPVKSPLTLSLSSLSSSASSSLSPPSSASISSHNVRTKPFRRKQPIESSEYDDSEDLNSDGDSFEGTSYSLAKRGKPNQPTLKFVLLFKHTHTQGVKVTERFYNINFMNGSCSSLFDIKTYF